LSTLACHLHEIEKRAGELRAVTLQSQSPRYFIVGADINALERLDVDSIVPWIERGHEVFDRLEDLPLPTLARVNGYALGGGLELAMACDLIIATEGARFGQPEAKLGFIAGWGGTHRLPIRVGRAKAKELFFSARMIDAPEALRLGLIDFLGDESAVDDYVTQLLGEIRDCSPLALAEMKRLVNRSGATDREASRLAETVASMRCISSPETLARVRAFLAARRERRQ
jgi:enoyl-CoA hydratase